MKDLNLPKFVNLVIAAIENGQGDGDSICLEFDGGLLREIGVFKSKDEYFIRTYISLKPYDANVASEICQKFGYQSTSSPDSDDVLLFKDYERNEAKKIAANEVNNVLLTSVGIYVPEPRTPIFSIKKVLLIVLIVWIICMVITYSLIFLLV